MALKFVAGVGSQFPRETTTVLAVKDAGIFKSPLLDVGEEHGVHIVGFKLGIIFPTVIDRLDGKICVIPSINTTESAARTTRIFSNRKG